MNRHTKKEALANRNKRKAWKTFAAGFAFWLLGNGFVFSDPFQGAPTAQPLSKRTVMPFANLGSQSQSLQAGKDFALDQILIKFKQPLPIQKQSLNKSSVEAVISPSLKSCGIQQLTPMVRRAPSSVSPMSLDSGQGALRRWYRAQLASNADPLKIVDAIRKEPSIETAEVDGFYHAEELNAIASPRAISPQSIPQGTGEDPLASQQWHLDAIQAREAWAHLQSLGLPPGGNRDVIVAVIDSGVDFNHPDLSGSMWTNSREIPGNGIDDDGNGIIDDVHGASFVYDHNGNPMDYQGHGTHVAGIIASQGNNAQGGIGIAYNVKIMAVQAFSLATIRWSDIAESIEYAAANGADVINMSFGGSAPSKAVEDALAVAFGRAVLVASAGNDSTPNLPHPRGVNNYPAAYNWVLGVMASDPSGQKAGFSCWDYIPNDENEYEIMAPGVGILSAFPNNQYQAASGTSMSAPVVSAVAALVRTKYSDKNMYSSRFIMGQIASTGDPAGSWKKVNALRALTSSPTPNLTFTEQRVFDSKSISANNDSDSVADAGETVDLAITLRNQWGKADQVIVKIEPKLPAGVADPFVSMLIDTVNYGAIGAFSSSDNGIIRDSSGLMQGVQNPFRFQISSECTNDHAIHFKLTVTYKNGMNSGDTAEYSYQNNFTVMVQRGYNLPDVISENMTLTKDNLYIVNNKTVLVDSGATLTITPGTQIQFGAPVFFNEDVVSLKPSFAVKGALNCEGTAEDPVEMFTWTNFSWVYISEIEGGRVNLKYARIMNPFIASANNIEHCYFREYRPNSSLDPFFSGGEAKIVAAKYSNNIFYKLNSYSAYVVPGKSDTYLAGNLFNNSSVLLGSADNTALNNYIHGNTFLNNYLVYSRYNSLQTNASQFKMWRWYNNSLEKRWGRGVCPTNVVIKGVQKTYFLIPAETPMNIAEQYAQFFGGHIATIRNAEENDFVWKWCQAMTSSDYAVQYPTAVGIYPDFPAIHWCYRVGLKYNLAIHDFQWISGEPFSYANWQSSKPSGAGEPFYLVINKSNGKWVWEDGNYTSPWIIEVPGIVTQKQIDSAHYDLISRISGKTSVINNNAFLNTWSRPDNTTWMKFECGEKTYQFYLNNNYWGTTSPSLIEGSFLDFRTDFNKGLIIYDPVLTNAPNDCYPFVEKVILDTPSDTNVTVVGAGLLKFNVFFNRDMNTQVQPEVSFGPNSPFQKCEVNGGWQTHRLWIGTNMITRTTGDGNHYMRIYGAVAADDSWLVAGEDMERFAFKIVTYGAESMDFTQTTGGNNCINLSWAQDEFETLAGYNIYRSTNPTNNFLRVNAWTIPWKVTTFQDTNVTAGVVYYYKFSVVTTELNETRFSNIAQATVNDSIPPVINHAPVAQALPGLPLSISAEITDNVVISWAKLAYRQIGASTFIKVAMKKISTNSFAGAIDGSLIIAPGLEYYIEASDGINTAFSGREIRPYTVNVSSNPAISSLSPLKGPASGATPIKIFGANFVSGTTVKFGGISANNVIFLNEHELTCTTPAHFPDVVDVEIINPNQRQTLYTGAFTYENDEAVLSISPKIAAPAEVFSLPIQILSANGLAAIDLSITYDPLILKLRNIEKGSMFNDWVLVPNTNQAGVIRLAMASSGVTVSGDGSVILLECEAIGPEGSAALIKFTSASLNGGHIPVHYGEGRVWISAVGTHSVSGKVVYGANNTPVPNVQITLQGSQKFLAASDSNGAFSFLNIPVDGYSMVPIKNDQVQGITSYDASLILQHSAGLLALNETALIAADVDRNQKIDAMDAFYVIQKAVDAISLPFPGADIIWDFTPINRRYTWLTNNQSGQDFSAVLLGDVSGNWSNPGVIEGKNSVFNGGANVYKTMSVNLGNSGIHGIEPLGDSNGTELAMMQVAYSNKIKVLYRTFKPIYSIDFKTVGLLDIHNHCAGFMLSSVDQAGGVVKGAMAGAIPLVGCGELFEGAIESQDTKAAIVSVSINEGNIPAQIKSSLDTFYADSDADGQSDLDEILAGTDACDSASRLKMLRVESNEEGALVTWSSIPGKKYLLQYSECLSDNAWLTLQSSIIATDVKTSAKDKTNANRVRFYRVQISE